MNALEAIARAQDAIARATLNESPHALIRNEALAALILSANRLRSIVAICEQRSDGSVRVKEGHGRQYAQLIEAADASFNT